MPRRPRIWYPGAMYHITSRGNRRSDIFLDDKDRLRYLRYLEETKEIMHKLNSRYAISFNKHMTMMVTSFKVVTIPS